MKKLLITAIVSSLLFFVFTSEKYISNKQDEYVCLPCGSDCDNVIHKEPGTCSQCKMVLIKKSTIKHKNIQPNDLCSFIKKNGSPDVLLLDVRTKAEFEGTAEEKFGKLNNAVNIPIQELESRMKELSAWKDKEIVVYCSHSHRSPRASYMLSQNGFTKVTNMLGGMSVWKGSVKDGNCNQQLFIKQ
jgi:rhodanese-related sulfurtransferase/DNA-directed RNA polymerase subunit RPC12/RpoP